MCKRIILLIAMIVSCAHAISEPISIGHLSLNEDPRRQQDWGYARMVLPPPVETVQAAQLALTDLEFLVEAAGLSIELDAREVSGRDELVAAVSSMMQAGVEFIVLDLPETELRAVADASRNLPVQLVNATAAQTSLRRGCWPNMLHSGPSQRMQMDAFAQHLLKMNWKRVLVLQGDRPDDEQFANEFVASAERMRLKIVDQRSFVLERDPANREENNVRLLTSGAKYDVVFIADTRGEFARYVPYGTQLPRPVIGSAGLRAEAWHWAMERNGAPQVSSRFDKAYGRKMTSADWSVWVAVKSIVSGYVKVPERDANAIRALLNSHTFRLDGSKGISLNYRPWNGQLRMPMVLATGDAVIATLPLKEFLHEQNTLDSLGANETEFRCD